MKTWTECGRLTLFFSVFGCSEQNGHRVKAEIDEWVCCFKDDVIMGSCWRFRDHDIEAITTWLEFHGKQVIGSWS